MKPLSNGKCLRVDYIVLASLQCNKHRTHDDGNSDITHKEPLSPSKYE